MTSRAETFRVVGPNGGTINLIERAAAERDSDSFDTRVTKRRAEAVQKQQQWMNTYYLGVVLTIVACDSQGKPIISRRKLFENTD